MKSSQGQLRVIVIEDEALVALDLEMLVEDRGHVITGEARCLDSARELPDDADPHLAFVDINLANGSSGIEVSALIRKRWPSVLVVFVTANPQRIVHDYSGAFAAIAKPFSRLGINAAVDYLAEEILDPPPRLALPDSLLVALH